MANLPRLKNITIAPNLVYVFFIPLVIIGKIVRYTFMKALVVDTGSGHGMLIFALEGGPVPEEGPGLIMLGVIAVLNSALGLSTYTQFEIIFSVICNAVIFLMLMKIKKQLSLAQAIFLVFSIMVLNIFSFTLSKEPGQMSYFVGIYLVLCSRMSKSAKFLLTVGIIILSALTFRMYYYIIVMFMIAGYIAMKILAGRKWNLAVLMGIIAVLAGVSYFILLIFGSRFSPDNYAELLRVRSPDRFITGATAIRPWLPIGSDILLTINYVTILFRMLFPIELIRMGVKYFPYVLYQLIITIAFLNGLSTYAKNSPSVNLAVMVFFGFFCCSAAFEPDFGSWIRHESVVFPIFLVMTKIRPVDEKRNLYVSSFTRLQSFWQRRRAG